jgi:hypothetical protein
MSTKQKYFILGAVIIASLILFFPRGADYFAEYLAKRDALERCEVIFTHSQYLCDTMPLSIELLKKGYGESIVIFNLEKTPFQKRCIEHYSLMTTGEMAHHMMINDRADTSMLMVLPEEKSMRDAGNALRRFWETDSFRSVLIVVKPLESRRLFLTVSDAFAESPVKIVSYPCFPESLIRDTYFEARDFYTALFSETLSLLSYMY